MATTPQTLTTSRSEAVVHVTAPAHGPLYLALVRLTQKRAAMMGLWVILTFYAVGIFAPVVAPYAFEQTDLNAAYQGPSVQHWFGADTAGRDHLSRVIWGARTSVIVSVASVISGSIFIGITLGALAGYL